MKAEIARKLAADSGLTSVFSKIKEACQHGEWKCSIPGRIRKGEKAYLKSLGYTISVPVSLVASFDISWEDING